MANAGLGVLDEHFFHRKCSFRLKTRYCEFILNLVHNFGGK